MTLEELKRKISSGQITREQLKVMRAKHPRAMNPEWCEWLMGYPIGWTLNRS